MMRTVLLSIAVCAAACGGKSRPTSTGATVDHAAEGEKHEHKFPAAVGAFHDKLSPLWHADAGKPRMDSTCAATGELDALAANVQKASAPDGVDAAAWSGKASALSDSIVKLSAACGDPEHATFEADFEGVHSAFHSLIELIPQPGQDPNRGASDLGVTPESSAGGAGGEHH